MAESAAGRQRQAEPGGVGGAGDGPRPYGRGHHHGPRAFLGGYLSLVSVSGRRPPPYASVRRTPGTVHFARYPQGGTFDAELTSAAQPRPALPRGRLHRPLAHARDDPPVTR